MAACIPNLNFTWRLLYVVVYSQQLPFRRGCVNERTGLDALEGKKSFASVRGGLQIWSANVGEEENVLHPN
jgi:hypothetical protein